ncbi:hypothetical protein L3V82_06185 [Thiotrichales bacterium 19S3-7]|nr:hypothetical protein [Thiotrichales bacterium 19S3-7]MCF6801684.1 hypothetical protein [Thiotrichales bacterium 19S3-11]
MKPSNAQSSYSPSNFALMHQIRQNDLIYLYRVCTKEEAQNTICLKCAGGEFKMLEKFTASNAEIINQIANNECFYNPKITNRNLASKRTLVEYSTSPLTQFKGKCILISVNQSFTIKGSNLPNEDGFLIQVGTPLNSVMLFDSPQQALQYFKLQQKNKAFNLNAPNSYFFDESLQQPNDFILGTDRTQPL